MFFQMFIKTSLAHSDGPRPCGEASWKAACLLQFSEGKKNHLAATVKRAECHHGHTANNPDHRHRALPRIAFVFPYLG